MKKEVLGKTIALSKNGDVSPQKGLHSSLLALYSAWEAKEQDEAIQHVLGFFNAYIEAGRSTTSDSSNRQG